MRPLLFATCIVLVAVLAPRAGRACAACGCGDPSLTLVGADAPASGTLRLSAESRTYKHETGSAGIDLESVSESRLTLGAAFTPNDRITASAYLPLVYHRLEVAAADGTALLGIGDAAVDVRVRVLRSGVFAPVHLASIIVGIKAPTGPLATTPAGNLISLDVQSGTGSWDPSLGVSYRYKPGKFSLFSSVIALWPTEGHMEVRAGRGVLTTLAPQFAATQNLTVALSFDGRISEANTLGAVHDVNSGGAALYLSPTVLWGPWTDFTWRATVQIPVLTAWKGRHTDSVALLLGASLAI